MRKWREAELTAPAMFRAAGTRNLARAVAASIGEVNAVLLANHGVVACGCDLEEAFVTSQILEKAALLLLLGARLGKVRSIPDKFVREERHRYLYKYGTAKDFQ